jgi:RHS repeat-associated protein
LGGWSLNVQHHWEDGDPPRLLLGAGGNFPVTRTFPHPDGTLVPDPSDAIAYVFDGPRRHVATVDAVNGRVLIRFEYAGVDLIGIVDADGQRTVVTRDDGDIVLTGPLGDVNRLEFDANDYLAAVTQPGDRRWAIAHDDSGLLETIAPPRVTAVDGAARHRFTYNADGQLIRDEGLDGEALRLVRRDRNDLSQVDLYRAMDAPDGTVRELKTSYRHWSDGRRATEFADRIDLTETLEEAELQGFDSGYRTRNADTSTVTVLVDDADRWAGGVARGRTIFQPRADTDLLPIAIETEERTVLAPDGPLGAQSIDHVETIIRRGGVVEGRSTLYPHGQPERFGGVPFVEATSAEGRRSVVLMDGGRVTQVQAGDLHPVRYTYDARGRVETVRQGPEGTERVTRFEYQDDLRAVIVTTPDGRRIQTRLNPALDVERTENMAVIDDEIRFGYDDGGALDALHTPSGTHVWQTSDGGRTATYTAPPVEGQPEGSTTQYAWGLDGRPMSVIEADGRETGFIYASETGLLDRLETSDQTIENAWRPDLQLQSSQVSARVLRDGTTIELSERPLYVGNRPYGAELTVTIDGVERIMSQSVELDPATWVPQRTVIEGANERTAAAELGFDRDGGLIRLGALNIDLSAQGAGLPGLAQIGELLTARTFSRFGEMDALHVEYAGTERYALQLRRDAQSGEITGVFECFLGAGGCNEWAYDFDAEGRLVAATPFHGTAYAFTYDVSGRRVERRADHQLEATQSVDAQDRLLRYADATYTYNAMGQRTGAFDTPSGDWAYAYDVRGGLRSVEGNDVVVEYVLDSAGRRIGRRENDGALTWWMYDGLHPVAEFDDQLRLRKRFYYGVRGHTPEYMTVHGADGLQTGRYHFVTNLVGSVAGVLDDGGDWVERTNYSPFGRPEVVIAAPADLRHPFGFAGGFKDAATGLVRFGARDYDPFTGQWLAKDPIGFAGGDPNLYGYVGQDPVRFFDPSGLQRRQTSFHGNGHFFNHVLTDADHYIGVPPSRETLIGVSVVIAEELLLNALTAGTATAGRLIYRGGRWVFDGAKKAVVAAWQRYRSWQASRKAKKASCIAFEKLPANMQKAVRSLRRRAKEHRDKLEAYRKNPDAFDNKGYLKNAPSSEVRTRIINGRIRHLEQEIKAFEDQIQRILGGN